MQPEKHGLKFVYLIQGDGSRPPYAVPKGSDYLLLQWQPTFIPHPNSFHFPKSSWAAGRNELLRRAREQADYDYFVYLDDDLTFGITWFRIATQITRKIVCVAKLILRGKKVPNGMLRPIWNVLRYAHAAWSLETFERMVATTKPLVAYPNLNINLINHSIGTNNEVDGVDTGDQCFVCIHRSVIDEVLPYPTAFDKTSWWKSAWAFTKQSVKVWERKKIHRYNRLFVMNLLGRPYPRASNPDAALNRVTTPDLT